MKIMKVSLGTFLLLLVSLPVWSATAEVGQTGQKICSAEDGTEITCTGTGQDGDFQIGPEVFPRFRDNSDGTVTDNLTGLIWLKNANCFDTKNWQDALTAANTLTNGKCGLTDESRGGDWRLPNFLELRSLVNRQYASPALSNAAGTDRWEEGNPFINIRTVIHSWSSTTDITSTDRASTMTIWDTRRFNAGKNTLSSTWPVKGGQSGSLEDSVILLPQTGQTTCYSTDGIPIDCTGTGQDGEIQAGIVFPNPRFTDNGDGTITDTLTDLIWLKNGNCPATATTWQNALNWVNQLNTDGTMNGFSCGDTSNSSSHQTDWRLPNINELSSLINLAGTNPISHLTPYFSSLSSSLYWSGTPYAYTGYAWLAFLGSSNSYYLKSTSSRVWAVRGGQKKSLYNLFISKAGTGSGSVTSNPVGIDCRNNCSQSYNPADTVTLTATSNSGSSFAGWSGQCSGSDVNTTITMDSTKNCIATFTEYFRPYTTSALVPQTGQKTIYESEDDGNIRAGATTPAPRFHDNKDGTVKDTLTGLTWLKDARCFGQQGWSAALTTASSLKNGNCGLTDDSAAGDWRLPNIRELRSLLNAQYVNPALSNTYGTAHMTNGNPFSISSSSYWSATTSALDRDLSWYVDFNDGLTWTFPKTTPYSVWPVKGGQSGALADPAVFLPQTGQKTTYTSGDDGAQQTGVVFPAPRFTDNGDGTILDNLTGLIWLQNAYCSGTGRRWLDARNDLAELNTSGTMRGNNCGDNSNNSSHQKDWRLPNVNELWSLIDFSQDSPALPSGHLFTNVQSYYYWTNTNSYSETNFIDISSGYINKVPRSLHYPSIWPVRGGQLELYKKNGMLLMIVPVISGNGQR
jgi:Protein of unknown function (DUF1566)/Divergent InlB B-repeat domain